MKVLFAQKMAGVAGSETYYLKLLPRLAAHGVEPTFLSLETAAERHLNDAFVDELVSAGVAVERIAVPRYGSVGALRRIDRLIRAGRFDLVQSNLIHADVWLALVKALFHRDLVLVSTKHGYKDSYQARHGLDPSFVRPDPMALATRFAARFANRIVAISQGLADFLAGARLVSPDQLDTIPYGFSFDQRVTEAAPGELRLGDPQLLLVGRLTAVKQVDLVLDCLPRLIAEFPGLKLVVVGIGPDADSLRHHAVARRLTDHVEWAGYRRNVHDYLRDSDLLVFASRAEGFGAVTLEAWFNRLPVVAFDVPAQNEIITHGHDGLLVAPFDRTAFEDALLSLLRDPALRRSLGANGEATYRERYTVDIMTARTVALYRSVLAAAGRGSTSAA